MRLAMVAVVVLLGGCARVPDETTSERARREHAAAYKAGRTAHEIARHSGQIAEKAARKIAQEAKAAGQGWKEQAREDRAKRDRQSAREQSRQ